MEIDMDEKINNVYLKVEDIAVSCRSVLERITCMSGSSGCSGELCDCMSIHENMKSSIDEVKRMFNSLVKRCKRIESENKERDESIKTLFQEIRKLKGNQEDVQGNRSRNKSVDERGNASNVETRLANRNEREQTYETKPETGDDKDNNSRRRSVTGTTNVGSTVSGNYIQSLKQPSGSSPLPRQRQKDNTETRSDRSMPTALVSKRSANVTPRTDLENSTMLYHSPRSMSVVDQNKDKEYYLSTEVWVVEARAEIIAANKTPIRDIEGTKTVLLLDISASMATGDKWTEAQTFVTEYLKGLELVAPRVDMKEFVSIVTFGHQTRCLQRYTNDFALLRTSFEHIQLGGPSPLYGGLTMAYAVAKTPKDSEFKLVNGMQVNTKVIVITDGEPTELCLHRGPDVADLDKMDETKSAMIENVEVMHNQDIDLYCVPVGNANMEFLNLLLSKETGRRILNFRDGNHFSRRLFLSNKFRPALVLFGGSRFSIPRDDPDINGRDYAHMQEILEEDNRKAHDAFLQQERNPYEERNFGNVLPIGTRVRRGPDWESGDQDGNGPGTVVGHHSYRDLVWINWDENSSIRQYRYGDLDKYCVFQVDEPRIPLPGQPIEVGCIVCPGKDWHSDVTQPGTRGVVYRMQVDQNNIRKAVVRWENGERAIHSYGDDGVYEIQIYLEDPSVLRALKGASNLQATGGEVKTNVTTTEIVKAPKMAKGQSQHRRQNKNKNAH